MYTWIKLCKEADVNYVTIQCDFDKHRAHPDPTKVSTIKEMPALQNKGELQNFLGIITHI